MSFNEITQSPYFAGVIIAVVVIYFIIAKVLPFFKKVRKATKGLFSKIYLNKSAATDPASYKKISLGAIYSEQQTAYINSLTTGLGSSIKEIAGKWWGIESSHDALSTLDYLSTKGFRFYLPAVVEAFPLSGDRQNSFIISQFNDPDDIEKAFSQLQNLRETLQELKDDQIITDVADISKYGVTGWDCGRLVFLARVCYDANYISEQQAWDYINKADELARRTFNSWEDYAKSYVIGRAMWGGASSNNRGIASIAAYLLKEANSPWVQMKW